MSETQIEVKGYTDPRTGEYVSAAEATQEQFEEAYGLIQAAMHYWDGPVQKRLVLGADHILKHEVTPAYSREAWLESDERQDWLESLTDEQRQMLAECLPPEELMPVGADSA